MNNCLKTQLKESVNNNNLDYFDTITLKVTPISNPTNSSQQLNARPFGEYGNEVFECKIVGDGNFFSGSYGGTNEGKSCTLSKNLQYIYLSNGTYTVYIKNKQKVTDGRYNMVRCDISKLRFNDIVRYGTDASALRTLMSGDIINMKGWDNIISINAAASLLVGDISAFSGKTSLINLNISDTSIHGDIDSVSTCTALQTLNIAPAANIYGDISNIVNNCLSLTELRITSNITITSEQISTLKNRGCSVYIDGVPQ